MSMADVLATLKARWMLMIATFVAVIALAVVAIVLLPSKYTAVASLVFSGPSQDPGAAANSATVQAVETTTLLTQADIIRSVSVTQLVIERLHLDREPYFRARWEKETQGDKPFEPWLAQTVLDMVDVVPVTNDNVLSINVKTIDPNLSATIANAFAQAFLDKQLQLQVDPARSYAQWFGSRSKGLRQNLEAAQARMTAYRQAHGLTGADRLDIETNRMNTLSDQLAAAQVQSADAGSRAGSQSSGSVEVLSSGVVQGLRAQIASKTGTLHQLEGTLGPNHPQVVAARDELTALEAKLSAETGNAAGALGVASRSARDREAALRAMLADQRKRVLAMSGNQDQLLVLQRDVDLARTAFENASQHTGSATLESQLQQSGASLLDTAQPPILPSSPKVPLILFLATVFGAMSGPALAIAFELLHPRARTRGGVEQATQGRVLVELPRLRPLRLARLG